MKTKPPSQSQNQTFTNSTSINRTYHLLSGYKQQWAKLALVKSYENVTF